MTGGEDFTLSPETIAAGFQLAAFEELNGSTNTEALQRGRQGEKGPLWIVTDHQLGGRGRRNRIWSSPKGNLAASLLLTTNVSLAVASTLGFVISLAAERAIARIAPFLQGRISLKWPNDILVDGSKLAGVLLESEAIDEKHRILVVGIGVNVVQAPVGVPYPAASLWSLGACAIASQLFTALAEEWFTHFTLWNGGQGMRSIRDLWIERAAGIGAPVAIQAGNAVLEGIFETIDDAGHLILRCADGRCMEIAAGEVHFGTAATVRKD